MMMGRKRRQQQQKRENHRIEQLEERVTRAEIELRALRRYVRRQPDLKRLVS